MQRGAARRDYRVLTRWVVVGVGKAVFSPLNAGVRVYDTSFNLLRTLGNDLVGAVSFRGIREHGTPHDRSTEAAGPSEIGVVRFRAQESDNRRFVWMVSRVGSNLGEFYTEEDNITFDGEPGTGYWRRVQAHAQEADAPRVSTGWL